MTQKSFQSITTVNSIFIFLLNFEDFTNTFHKLLVSLKKKKPRHIVSINSFKLYIENSLLACIISWNCVAIACFNFYPLSQFKMSCYKKKSQNSTFQDKEV